MSLLSTCRPLNGRSKLRISSAASCRALPCAFATSRRSFASKNLATSKVTALPPAGQSSSGWAGFSTGFRRGRAAPTCGRTKLWWNSSILPINEQPGFDPVDTLVVVTHGLTMRLILMQLFGWSPNTFGSVWNAENCGCYVLNKDLSLPGFSPYALDEVSGDKVVSSIHLIAHMANGTQRGLKLDDYLSIPSPRSKHEHLVIQRLAEQHALDPQTISRVDFRGGRCGFNSNVAPPRGGQEQDRTAQDPGVTRCRN